MIGKSSNRGSHNHAILLLICCLITFTERNLIHYHIVSANTLINFSHRDGPHIVWNVHQLWLDYRLLFAPFVDARAAFDYWGAGY
jgi:hypothetical protein